MKRILFIVIAFTFVGSICFAQGTESKEPETFIGKVVSVTVQEPAKGVVKVLDDATDMTLEFPVEPTTKILDDTLNMVTLGQLKKDDKVEVRRSADKPEAESIKVMK